MAYLNYKSETDGARSPELGDYGLDKNKLTGYSLALYNKAQAVWNDVEKLREPLIIWILKNKAVANRIYEKWKTER